MSNEFMAEPSDVPRPGEEPGVTVIERDPKIDKKSKLEHPRMWKVIFLNDDYTPMNFVISVLVHYFHKTEVEAADIMLDIHNKGKGIAGVFTYEVAEHKVYEVMSTARENELPLRVIAEPED